MINLDSAFYSAIKKNTFESVLMRWMKLEEVCRGCVAKQISETKGSEVFHKSCLRVLIKMGSRLKDVKEESLELS